MKHWMHMRLVHCIRHSTVCKRNNDIPRTGWDFLLFSFLPKKQLRSKRTSSGCGERRWSPTFVDDHSSGSMHWWRGRLRTAEGRSVWRSVQWRQSMSGSAVTHNRCRRTTNSEWRAFTENRTTHNESRRRWGQVSILCTPIEGTPVSAARTHHWPLGPSDVSVAEGRGPPCAHSRKNMARKKPAHFSVPIDLRESFFAPHFF